MPSPLASAGWGLLACMGLVLALMGARVQPLAAPSAETLLWVNERPISSAQLRYAEQRLTGDITKRLGQDESRTVIELLIDEELLLQRAESLGILETDPGVRKMIVQAAIGETVEAFLSQPIDQHVLQQFFQRHSAVFEHPLRVAVSALRFDSLAAAKHAIAILDDGSAWADLAALPEAQPVTHLPGSPLPAHVLRRYLGPGLASVALSLKPGQISQPVESAGGAYLLQVVSVTPPTVPDFDKIVLDVRAEYLSRGREDALANKLADLWQSADIQFSTPVVGNLAGETIGQLVQ
ncbi:MAG: peptidylprolyl isomerase [Halioglobus sp.]